MADYYEEGGYDYLFKIILLGDVDSRKMDFLCTYTGKNRDRTLGVDYFLRNVEHRGKIIRMQLWDTSGLERFRSVTSSYYRGSHGVLIVFNCCVMTTFNHLDLWLEELKELAPKDCVKVLVGTCTPVEESDSSGGKMVSTQVAEAYAAQKGLTYVECNPLDSEAVSRVINHLLAQVVRQWGTDTITRESRMLVPRHADAQSANDEQKNSCKCS